MDKPKAQPPAKRSLLRDGMWIAVAALLIITGGTIWQISNSLSKRDERITADSTDPASYGFDLNTLTVPAQFIAAAGKPLPEYGAMDEPGHISLAELEKLNTEGHSKYVLPNDRVIGVSVGGAARAYPLRVLTWHEAVNDDLEGAAICVTYSGLTDSAVVFDRRLAGQTRRFAASGLLFNSNLVLYDSSSPEGERSLFSQLMAEGIAGPLAGASLTCVDAEVLQWRDWLARHPETTILARDPNLTASYKKDLYGPYYQTGELRFPVDLPDAVIAEDAPMELKERVVGLRVGGRAVAMPYKIVLENARFDDDGLGVWSTQLAGAPLTFMCRKPDIGFAPETVWLAERAPANALIAPCSLWFAWSAMHFEEP